MKLSRGLVLGGMLLALAACSNKNSFSEVRALNEAKPVGSPFTQALAEQYRTFSNTDLSKKYDYPDALHFARKGLAAASGEVVLPEPISDWNLLPEHMNELATARGRLLVSFDRGARELSPKQAAIAQVRFDCWIQEQEANWQAKEISGCKSQFMSAMTQVEQTVGAGNAPPPVEAQSPSAATPMKPEDAMYLVFFDWNKYNITAGGDSVLDAVANEAKSHNLTAVHVVGNTDTSGTHGYNNKLGLKRAEAVRAALIKRGVEGSEIDVQTHGEDDLLVPTPPGVREPANRRAQISFEGSSK